MIGGLEMVGSPILQEQATPHKVIEKRRRDRINHSLDELRAILPASKRSQVGYSCAAVARNCLIILLLRLQLQGVRNDKVDLLQMTIDHLKELQEANKGSKNGSQGLARERSRFAITCFLSIAGTQPTLT